MFASDAEAIAHTGTRRGGVYDKTTNEFIREHSAELRIDSADEFLATQSPNLVSASTRAGVAGKLPYTQAYDIPNEVFAKLPQPNPLQNEVVFYGSIPAEYMVGTFAK